MAEERVTRHVVGVNPTTELLSSAVLWTGCMWKSSGQAHKYGA